MSEVLTYAEFRKIDDIMPYEAYLQGQIEDTIITPWDFTRLMGDAKRTSLINLGEAIHNDADKETLVRLFEEVKRIVRA